MIFAVVLSISPAACVDSLGAYLEPEAPERADIATEAGCLWPALVQRAQGALDLNMTQLAESIDDEARPACRALWSNLSRVLSTATSAACPESSAGQVRDQDMIAQCHADQSAMELREAPIVNESDCPNADYTALMLSVIVRFEGAALLFNELQAGLAVPERSAAYWSAAYYPAQHAEMAPEIQEAWLEAVEAAVAAGGAGPYLQAALADRLAIARDQVQLYGSHTLCAEGQARLEPALDNVAAAEARRAEIGLPDLSAFLDSRTRSLCTPH